MQAAGSPQALLSQPTQLQHLLGPPMGSANPLTQLLMLGSLVSQPLLTGLSPAALTGKPPPLDRLYTGNAWSAHGL